MGEGGGNERRKMERGICRREEDRRVFFSDAARSSSAFFAKSCLFDQGYVVLCVAGVFLLFFSLLWLSDSMLLDFTATIKGVWQWETAKYRLCTIFVTSVPPLLSLWPTYLPTACRFASWILTGFVSYQFCSSSLPSVCGRQGSYQGPGISQASTMATTVPYSQPTGNNSSAMGNAQGPAYNMTPSGILA